MPLGYCFRFGARVLQKTTKVVLTSFCITLTFAFSAGAVEQFRGLQYHATVINGNIIGSAFMIFDGLIVTNAHVVKGRRPGDRLVLSSQKRVSQSAKVLAISKRMDLAILQVSREFIPVAPYMKKNT